MTDDTGQPASPGPSPAEPPAETSSADATTLPRFEPFADAPPAAPPTAPTMPTQPFAPLPPVAPLPQAMPAAESAAPEPVAPAAPDSLAAMPIMTPDVPSSFTAVEPPSPPVYVPPMPAGGSVAPSADPSTLPTSAWVGTVAPPAPKKRGLLPTIITVVAVIIGLAVIAVIALGPSDKGQILFGTAAGDGDCTVGNQTTSVAVGVPVYFTAVLKDRMDGNQDVTLAVSKDGGPPVTADEPANGTAFDCLIGTPDDLTSIIGTPTSGVYHFVLTNNGNTEATGDLTVK